MSKYHKIKNMINTGGGEWREGEGKEKGSEGKRERGRDSCWGEALRDGSDEF